MNTKKYRDFWIIFILVFASLLRLYRLDALTEFLGDQGRTMLVMKNFIEHGVIPLSGPTTLSGHHLGPIFYYLLIPGYILYIGPVGVALWMTVLGVLAVYILYKTSNLMFGILPARLVVLLWAVSPQIVSSDRTIWEPNLVPLFVLLYMYFLVLSHRTMKARFWVAVGVCVGVLVQLHYPTIIFIVFTGLSVFGAGLLKKRSLLDALRIGWYWFIGFILTIIPFLLYEYSAKFIDVFGVAFVMANGGGEILSKRAIVGFAIDYGARVFGRVLPNMTQPIFLMILFIWSICVLYFPSKKSIFFSLLFIVGVISMARYSGVVYDHYLYFLIPIPYFMLGTVLANITQKIWKITTIIIVMTLSLIQVSKTDIFTGGYHDIQRVSAIVSAIKSISVRSSFSFTLIESRSFSDLHYRYFMNNAGLFPHRITDNTYEYLFLICDLMRCPSGNTIGSMNRVTAMCYDDHCKGDYPEISLVNNWVFDEEKSFISPKLLGGALYVFRRK